MNDEATAPVVKRLKREVDYLWYADYKCHCFGKKQAKTFVHLSGKQRELQKASKKCNCLALLKVTCYKSNPGMVTLKVINEHNHEVVGSEDIKHLPLSKEARDYIEGRLREGYRKRETRLSIQKNYREYMRGLTEDTVPLYLRPFDLRPFPI